MADDGSIARSIGVTANTGLTADLRYLADQFPASNLPAPRRGLVQGRREEG